MQHAARAVLQFVCPFVVADWERDNAADRACGVVAHAYWVCVLSWNWIWYAIARLHRISMFVTKPRSQGDDALKACGLRWEDGSNLWFQ